MTFIAESIHLLVVSNLEAISDNDHTQPEQKLLLYALSAERVIAQY
jgi:hypothetical protein